MCEYSDCTIDWQAKDKSCLRVSGDDTDTNDYCNK